MAAIVVILSKVNGSHVYIEYLCPEESATKEKEVVFGKKKNELGRRNENSDLRYSE